MKTIRFNFNHPVKGTAVLSPVNCRAGLCRRMKIESTQNNLLEIPVSDCDEGTWKLSLDWEHDGRMYSHQENFEVAKQK